MNTVVQLGDPNRHFWMTRSVARALGVSLSEAMAEGTLSKQAYADMVTNCRKCQCVAECESWLATCGLRAETPPDCCRHAALLTELQNRDR